MFWGLIMEPRKRYTQVVERPFHISMAALDISSQNTEPAQIMATVDERNYLLCTLQKGKLIQCPLDLTFETGEEISFATNGNSHIHLTGYLIMDGYSDEEDEEDDEEEDEDMDQNFIRRNEYDGDALIPSKRKAITQGVDVSTKKLKTSALLEASLNSNDESDDSDVNSDILMAAEEDDSEEEENSDDAEEEQESDEDDDGEEEEDDSDNVFSELLNQKKGQQNGTASPKELKKSKQDSLQKNTSPKNSNKESQVQLTPKATIKSEKTPKKDKQQTPKGEKTPKSEKKQKDKTPAQNQSPASLPQKKTVEGGVMVEDLKVGTGPVAKYGKQLLVYYEGRLKQNNKMFDSMAHGKGFRFKLGGQEVIKGWEVGVNGMRVGGKRKLVIPASMGYGNKGSPPVIPPNSTLIFEIELKNII